MLQGNRDEWVREPAALDDPELPDGEMDDVLKERLVRGRRLSNSRDKFCITETYRIIETAIGRNLTRNEVIAAMNGNSTLVAELDAVVNSGALCTGCVSRLIYARTQSITSANIPNAIEPAQRKCGVKFGSASHRGSGLTTALVNPEGVHVPGNATESAAKFTMPPQAVAATARVENGGTEPRGISWKRLAAPLGVIGYQVFWV